MSSSGDWMRSPCRTDRVQVRATRDHRDVVTVLREPGRDHAADRARAVDDEPHRYGASRSRKNASTRS